MSTKDTEFVMKPITDLYVGCSRQVRNFDRPLMAASDTCQNHATSGVVDSKNDAIWWRCPDHEGQLDDGTEGAVVGGVLREVK